MESFGYKALKGENDDLIICEDIGFNNLGSFLYYDFFIGIKQNFVPNRCHNCGKFFLISGKWYYTYCNNSLKNELDKTCRDVGDKCKNDLVWADLQSCIQGTLCEVHEKEDDGFRI